MAHGGRALYGGVVASQAGVEFDEAGGLIGHLFDEVGALEFFQMSAVVFADAEEFIGVLNRRQKVDVA